MGSEIVEKDDVVGFEGGNEFLLDIGSETFAVDRTVEPAGRVDAIVPQRRDEGRGLPMAMRRRLVDEALSALRPAVEARHVGLGPGLVDEHEPGRIDPPLRFAPSLAVARDVRAGLLTRDQRLF